VSQTHPEANERRSRATRWAAVVKAAHNLALLRRLALTLLQHESTTRCGIKAKRLKAGWDHRYLLQVLAS